MKYLLLVLVIVGACSDEAPTPDAALRMTLSADRTDGLIANGSDGTTLTVRVFDENEQPVAGAAVELTISGRDNVFAPVAPTDAAGETTTVLTTTAAERKDVSATVGTELEDSLAITFGAGPAHALDFRVQPALSFVGIDLTPAIQLAVTDAFGNAATEAGTVSLTLGANPGSATLAGTTTRPLVDGVVTFSDLAIDAPANGYKLTASSSLALDPITSTAFDVLVGPPSPTTSTLVTVPGTGLADGSASIQVTATFRTASNEPISNARVRVSVSGTNNFVMAAGGTTDHNGAFSTHIGSTTAEAKTITVEAATLALTGTATFTPAPCQPQLPGPPVRPYDKRVHSMVVDDFDNDGHPDVAFAEDDGISVVRNVGTGGQLSPERQFTWSFTSWITSADVDQDGDVDLVVASSAAQTIGVFLGDGFGNFAAPITTAVTGYPLAVELTRVDSDSVVDAVVRTDNDIVVFSGLGNGTFQPAVTYSFGTTSSVSAAALELVDVSGDGRADIITADSNYRFITMLANANGTFQAPVSLGGMYADGRLSVADFDEDGDLDVLLTDSGMAMMVNDGTGAFTLRSVPSLGVSGGAVVGDFNADSHIDVASGGDFGVSLKVFYGQGNGSFVAVSDLVTSGGGPLAITDVDGDARPDLVTAQGYAGTNRLDVLLGAPTGGFIAPTITTKSGKFFSVAGDFDGTGSLDLVAYAMPTNALMLYLNQGGAFVAGPALTPPSDGSEIVAVGDFDNDAKLDLVSSGPLRVYRGNGDGSLQQALASPSLTGSRWEAGDLNNDGTLDLVGIQAFHTLGVVFGVGDGTFVQGPTFDVPTDPEQIVVADLDNDGDLDFAVGIRTDSSPVNTLVIARNQGDGTFTTSTTNGPGSLYGLAAGDFDLDGNIDLVSPVTHESNGVAVLLGNGDATFRPYVRYPTRTMVSHVHVVELDGDQHPDVLAFGPSITLLLGNGDGTFSPPLHYVGTTWQAIVADFTADGRSDLLLPRDGGFALLPNQGCL